MSGAWDVEPPPFHTNREGYQIAGSPRAKAAKDADAARGAALRREAEAVKKQLAAIKRNRGRGL